MMENVCRNCLWWQLSQKQGDIGRCHGGPPTAIGHGTIGAFPLTAATDYCGTFKHDARRNEEQTK